MLIIRKLFKVLMVCTLLLGGLITTTAENTEAAGYGQWINIDKNWRFRVDKPKQGGSSDDVQYHVHVEGKVGSKKVQSSEGVNEKDSHKTNMDEDGVPNWVQKEIKSSQVYKKGQADQKKLEKAKSDARKINWWNPVETAAAITAIVVITGTMVYMTITQWKNFVFA